MSIQYYDKNATSFLARTFDINMESLYKKFLKHVPINAAILDAGCGTGRDAKYFREKGYQVTAFDASQEMVRISSEVVGYPTLHMRFQDIGYDFENKFDAIWANASLLHIPYTELKEVLALLYLSLKSKGILYATFKYGSEERIMGDRTFYDMHEESIKPYMDGLYDIQEIWKEQDMRTKLGVTSPEFWLHILCKKKN